VTRIDLLYKKKKFKYVKCKILTWLSAGLAVKSQPTVFSE